MMTYMVSEGRLFSLKDLRVARVAWQRRARRFDHAAFLISTPVCFAAMVAPAYTDVQVGRSYAQ
jgi:hypothetical protein